MTHGWSLPVLLLEACGRGHAVNQSRLLPVLGLGPLSKRHRACRGQLWIAWDLQAF